LLDRELDILLVCIPCSLFWTLFYVHYAHFARVREYVAAQQKQYETEADEIHKLPIENLRTPAELAAFIEPRRKAARIRGEDAKYHGKREAIYEFMWQWSSRVSRLAFLVGLIMLLLFAIKNM
jgi:hypothetical protein